MTGGGLLGMTRAERARAEAAALARQISIHHQGCSLCARGGRVVAGPGGVRRERCPVEAALFAQLAAAQADELPRTQK